jgi:hypothetical protein
MKKVEGLKFFTVLLVLLVALVVFSPAAQANVYDDFTTPGIDTNLWVDRGTNYGLFSQPGDSYLYFNDSSGGQNDRLRSYNPVSGAFSVSLQYSNLQVTNPGGAWQGSSVVLRVGDANCWVDMMGWKNSLGQGFQANYNTTEGWTCLNYVVQNADSGWLKITYNGILGSGGKIEFWYDSGTGWTKLASCS